jgi:hypothetical protein
VKRALCYVDGITLTQRVSIAVMYLIRMRDLGLHGSNPCAALGSLTEVICSFLPGKFQYITNKYKTHSRLQEILKKSYAVLESAVQTVSIRAPSVAHKCPSGSVFLPGVLQHLGCHTNKCISDSYTEFRAATFIDRLVPLYNPEAENP